MPLFSIITPTFNRLPLLRQAVASIGAQRFQDFEHIIVDDGSTDGTAEYLDSIAASVRILKQANAGPGAARNTALQHATGEYVAFLDSDDLWQPWSLAAYHEVIQRHDRPSFITGKMRRFAKEQDFFDAPELPLESNWRSDYLATNEPPTWYGLSSIVMKRELIQAAGGFTNLPINGEDADLALRLGVAPGFVEVLNPVIYGYREHGGNVRREVSKTADGALFLATQEENGRYPGGVARAVQRWRAITPMTRSCSIACLNHGMRNRAWELYWRTAHWHWALRRWKYLLAFPLVALKTRFAGSWVGQDDAKNFPVVRC